MSTASVDSGPLQIAVSDTAGPDRARLAEAARRNAPGGSVVVVGEPDSAELLSGRPMIDGTPAAYVCRGFVCDRPVTDPANLAALLTRR